MDLEELPSVRSAMEPPWDDVREQRVLGRILEARSAPAKRRLRAAVVAFALVAAVIFGLVAWRGPLFRGAPAVNVASAPASPPAMSFADGSEAILFGDARVQVDEQRPERVQLTQRSGKVHYKVQHNPARPFIVRAGDVEVHVRGTEFVVTTNGGSVEVRVVQGRVAVNDGARSREIVTGEELRVPSHVAPEPSTPEQTPPPGVDEPRPPIATKGHENKPADVDTLLAQADRARAAGRFDEATTALQTLIARYPHDPRVPSALFALGRVKRGSGQHAAAADAFARAWQASPGGSLAEDALAEEVASLRAAGEEDRARAEAHRYLKIYPNGGYASRMRTSLGE